MDEGGTGPCRYLQSGVQLRRNPARVIITLCRINTNEHVPSQQRAVNQVTVLVVVFTLVLFLAAFGGLGGSEHLSPPRSLKRSTAVVFIRNVRIVALGRQPGSSQRRTLPLPAASCRSRGSTFATCLLADPQAVPLSITRGSG